MAAALQPAEIATARPPRAGPPPAARRSVPLPEPHREPDHRDQQRQQHEQRAVETDRARQPRPDLAGEREPRV